MDHSKDNFENKYLIFKLLQILKIIASFSNELS